MKKIFVTGLAVLNLLFASAQEDQSNVSSTPIGVSAETATVVESQPVENQSVKVTESNTKPAEPVEQPVSRHNESQSAATSSASSSDDFDSDYFSSNSDYSSSNESNSNHIGIRFGYTSSRATSVGVYSGAVSGFTFGAVDQIWFGETNVFGEVGLFFTQKGYTLKQFEPSETRINYLETPVMICHRIGRETLSITAKAGGYLACGVKGTLKTFISDSPAAIDLFKAEHQYDLFKEGAIGRFDAGVRFGLAIVVRKVMLGCRYDLGLYKIDKKDIIYGDDALMLGYKQLQNRSFQILMGINFN